MSKAKQTNFGLSDTTPVEKVEEYRFEPIKGYPMLTWRGKRPFTSTHFYPAQLKEVYGSEIDGWRNKIYWGDNLQVMGHLLKQFRGKVELIYIDPPFDSKADYKKKISLHGKAAANDHSPFEEKQYTDIWTNDEYLQYLYERLVLARELISENGSIYLHCDWHKSHYIRMIMDEIFGSDSFRNEIIWQRTYAHSGANQYGVIHDTILYYTKSNNWIWNVIKTDLEDEYIETFFDQVEEGTGRQYARVDLTAAGVTKDGDSGKPWRGINPTLKGRHWAFHPDTLEQLDKEGKIHWPKNGVPRLKRYADEADGKPLQDIWTDIRKIHNQSSELIGYPTQKPEVLLDRIIRASSNPGGLVFDCFMGSGTTQSVAMKLGRRFIGADINLGAVQITTKRLLETSEELRGKDRQSELFSENKKESAPVTLHTGFEVYNVNYYDVFRNPVEARELLLDALEVNKLSQGQLFDGEKDGRMVKIMPVNRIASRADLGELIAGLDLKAFAKRQKSNPKDAVEKITLVCMGHEPDLKASLMKEAEPYKLDVEVVDILRDRQDLQFKRDSEAKVSINKGKLVIESFYPMNLLGKLSLQKEKVKNWQELVESVMIDWNYDGAVLTPTTVDIPEKDEMVSGNYPVPKDAGTIRVKITDLLSESLEIEVVNA